MLGADKISGVALGNKTNSPTKITNTTTNTTQKTKKQKNVNKSLTENEIFLSKCKYYKINKCYHTEMDISEINFYKKKELFLKEKKIYLAKQKQEVADNEQNEISIILDDLSLYNTEKNVQKMILRSANVTSIDVKIDRSIYLDYLHSPTQVKYVINNTDEFKDIPFYYGNPEFNNNVSNLSQHTIDNTDYFIANNNSMYVLSDNNDMSQATIDNVPMTYNPIYMPLI